MGIEDRPTMQEVVNLFEAIVESLGSSRSVGELYKSEAETNKAQTFLSETMRERNDELANLRQQQEILKRQIKELKGRNSSLSVPAVAPPAPVNSVRGNTGGRRRLKEIFSSSALRYLLLALAMLGCAVWIHRARRSRKPLLPLHA